MKLYYCETLNPRKACAVARYLNSPVEFIRVNLAKGEHKTPEFLAINPNGKVPVLQDGDMTLWEANAIMCHLSNAADAHLWPQDAPRQVEIMRWLSWDAHHFTRHAGTLYFENIIKPMIGMGEPVAAAVDSATAFFRTNAAILDAHLGKRKFLVGDALTIADFATAVTLPYADAAKIPLDEFPAIRRWHARLQELPAWREPFPA
ncbi:MAG: glutathione S-transferase family protein [Herbaspirillum sp.]|nr:glutathione S-transferase family protein [Herbaspirillum sp.]